MRDAHGIPPNDRWVASSFNGPDVGVDTRVGVSHDEASSSQQGRETHGLGVCRSRYWDGAFCSTPR